jgi:hypothetical protein
MKLGTIIIAVTIALPATATFAQTRAPASPAARQDMGDPLNQRRTSEERAAGVTTGRARHNAPRLHQGIGGRPSSQQSGTDNGG